MELSHKEKLSLVSHLVEMTAIDGLWTEQEIEFMNRVLDRLGLEFLEIDRIKSGFVSGIEAFPKDEISRVTYFHHLLLLMAVDSNFDAEEENFLKKLGFNLGIRVYVIDEVIKAIKKHFPKPIPTKELQEIYMSTNN